MAALVLASSVIMNGACSKQTPGMGPIDLAKLLVSAPELSGSQEALVSARSIVNDGSYIENLMRFTEQQQKDAAVAASVPGNKVDEVGQALALEHEKKIKGVIKEEQEREAKELSARLLDTSANSVLQAFKNSLLDVGASSFPSLSSPSSSLPSSSSPSSSASDTHSSSSDSHSSSSSDSSSSSHHHSHHSHPSTAHTWSQDEMRFTAPRQSLMPYGQSSQASYPYAPSQYYHPMQSAYNSYPSAYDRTTYPSTASSYQALSYPLSGYSAPDATSSTTSSSSSAHHTKHKTHHHENEDDNEQHRFRERNEDESREQEEADYEAEAYAAAQAQLQAQAQTQAQAGTPYNDYRFSSARTGGSSYYKNAFTGHDVAYSAQARYGSPPEPPLPDLPPPPVAIPQ